MDTGPASCDMLGFQPLRVAEICAMQMSCDGRDGYELLNAKRFLSVIGSIVNLKLIWGWLKTYMITIFGGITWNKHPWARDLFGYHPGTRVSTHNHIALLPSPAWKRNLHPSWCVLDVTLKEFAFVKQLKLQHLCYLETPLNKSIWIFQLLFNLQEVISHPTGIFWSPLSPWFLRRLVGWDVLNDCTYSYPISAPWCGHI